MMKNTSSKTRGFTLIELLVVIAIIGVLASVVLVSLNSARKRGADTRVISDVNQVRALLETDYAGGNYSADLQSNSVAATQGVGTTNASSTMNALFADAKTNGGYIIVVSNSGQTAFAVFGALPSQNNTKFFCSASNGSTNQATGTPATGYISC